MNTIVLCWDCLFSTLFLAIKYSAKTFRIDSREMFDLMLTLNVIFIELLPYC